MHKLRIPDNLVKMIRTLHPEIKRKMKGAFKNIVTNPYSGKALKEELEDLRSLRVGKFRIIYILKSPEEIQIVAIGPRKTIYEETYRLLTRSMKNKGKD